MESYNYNRVYSGEQTLQQYMTKVFAVMGSGLAITAIVAGLGYYSLFTGGIFAQIYVRFYSIISIVSLFVQLGICFAMGKGIATRSVGKTRMLFYIYSAITGVTFSFLPLAFGVATVFTAFAFAAVMFISCAVIGHFTNVDMSKFSGLLMGGLFALVLITLLGMFIPAIGNSMLISYVGVALFLGLTAWDMQRIRAFYYQSAGDATLTGNLAVYGAFELYLDFINIFLYILRIMGSSSSRD